MQVPCYFPRKLKLNKISFPWFKLNKDWPQRQKLKSYTQCDFLICTINFTKDTLMETNESDEKTD